MHLDYTSPDERRIAPPKSLSPTGACEVCGSPPSSSEGWEWCSSCRSIRANAEVLRWREMMLCCEREAPRCQCGDAAYGDVELDLVYDKYGFYVPNTLCDNCWFKEEAACPKLRDALRAIVEKRSWTLIEPCDKYAPLDDDDDEEALWITRTPSE